MPEAEPSSRPVESPLSGTPAVFVKADDIINQNTSDYKVFQAVANCIGTADQLIGGQRIGKLWRIYPKNVDSRVKLLTNQINIDGQQIPVYAENPFRTGARDPEDKKVRITIKDLPLSKGNTALQSYLEGKGVKITSRIEYAKARDPVSHRLSEWLNGDRICFAEKLSTALPRTAHIGDSQVRIFHEGQPSPVERLCTRCFATDHYRSRCQNPACCNRCRKPGHNPGDPACPASLSEPQEDIRTIQGKDDVLSNHYPCDIKLHGKDMKSGEHGYQYTKAFRRGDLDVAKKIVDARNASGAKFQSCFLDYNKNWKAQKEEVMRDVLEAKYDQVPEFRKALLESKGKKLVETVRNQVYWGSGLDSQDTLHTKPEWWMGKNRLGELLMELREEKLVEERKEWRKAQKNKEQGNRPKTRHHLKSSGARAEASDFMTDSGDEGSVN